MRTIIRTCLAAICITATACLCAIMISACILALQAPPAQHAPALNPALHCDFFDTCAVDTSGVDDRR